MYYLNTKPYKWYSSSPDWLEEMAKACCRLREEFLVKEVIKIGQQTIITTEDVEPETAQFAKRKLIFKED